jgi:phosphoserine phosphatase RsbU/P
LFVLLAAAATAQINDATRMGGSVPLNTWRLQAGDDPRWAAANFDDSSWRVIPADKAWDELGIGNLRGYIWLRARVLIPEGVSRLGISASMIGPHQVFANGKLIGEAGEFPPRGLLYTETPVLYEFGTGPGRAVELALRVWLWPALNRIGRWPGAVLIGPADVIRGAAELQMRQILDGQIAYYVIDVLYTVLAGGLIILFILQRKQTEYLWLSFAIIPGVVSGIINAHAVMVSTDARWASYSSSICDALSAVCLLEFVFRFLKEPVPRWLRIYQFAFALNLLRSYAALHSWISLSDSNVAILLFYIPYWFATPLIVLWRYFRGNKEAGLLAIPLFLMFAVDMSNTLHWVLWRLRLRQTVNAFLPDLKAGLVTISPESITHFLFFLSIAALILYRFQRVRSEQARAQAELEAARSMQEVMVPPLIAVDGFRIDTAYLPAKEVGGDFYQIFPGEDGSLLVVIGDVSGKGVKAAMLVGFIIGLLRRTTKDTREPARVLRDVNDLLAGQTDGRFATCCCALIDSGGSVLICNAGHLSPYCGGVEIETPGGVPLGLAGGIEYDQIAFQIPAGQRILFLSDGVVEARNGSGELYGFERTRLSSIETVQRIAEIAQEYGQEDDITVLGVQLASASV